MVSRSDEARWAQPAMPDVAERGRVRLLLAGVAALCALPSAAQALSEQIKRLHNAGGEPIGVIFPDMGDPWRKIFGEIIGGVEDLTKLRVRPYPIGADQNMNDLSAALKRNGTRVVIALGGRGLNAAGAIDLPAVIGGINTVADSDSKLGVSLTPDPALLFPHIKGLLPGLRRIIVIYNPANSGWLIKLAREAARAHGLELQTNEARDLASAARQYEASFAAADPKHDAIWLPHDSTTVDETTIMPIVLRESWNRAVPVFSSSLGHLKRGALFALYPDNAELGRTLGGLAVGVLSGDTRRGMSPLREVRAALNTRTASHIGLNLSAKQLRGYDYIYPEP